MLFGSSKDEPDSASLARTRMAKLDVVALVGQRGWAVFVSTRWDRRKHARPSIKSSSTKQVQVIYRDCPNKASGEFVP